MPLLPREMPGGIPPGGCFLLLSGLGFYALDGEANGFNDTGGWIVWTVDVENSQSPSLLLVFGREPEGVSSAQKSGKSDLYLYGQPVSGTVLVFAMEDTDNGKAHRAMIQSVARIPPAACPLPKPRRPFSTEQPGQVEGIAGICAA
jgi:hypothetical protein